ncbi:MULTISPECIES: hypothetical protein [Actinomadura]|uniref:Uncharacterized protein n=1 Tax=Actinomadura litoris TaxID=2678616 RepID=A0A7K1L4C6_9ACTN|nr:MULTISPECIES: hypothetical protein [Actinomadura]MBT2209913.1 hypothetical protein [Actinomadura sp. NEAU-AAG7]MUN39260.1 hypothetical protein [Actinomadura litoris]
MTRFATWLGKNADAFIALILAITVAVLGVGVDLPHEDEVTNSAILAVVGLLATSVLRDRGRRVPVEAEVRDTLRASSATLDELSGKLTHIETFEGVLADTKRALDETTIVRVISGAQVAQVLEEARRDTDRWIFKGGTGTYIRAKTLPETVAAARRDGRTLLFRLEIIDPTDVEVCEAYARHRRSSADGPDGTGEPWTLERTRKEAYATILAACWHKQRFGMLDIDIGLARTMTTLRYDLSSSLIVVTRDNPRGQALVVDSTKFYYSWLSAELLTSLDQARRVPVEQARLAPLDDEPTVEEVRRLFEVIGIDMAQGYTDRDVIEIIRKALRPKDPYE